MLYNNLSMLFNSGDQCKYLGMNLSPVFADTAIIDTIAIASTRAAIGPNSGIAVAGLTCPTIWN